MTCWHSLPARGKWFDFHLDHLSNVNELSWWLEFPWCETTLCFHLKLLEFKTNKLSIKFNDKKNQNTFLSTVCRIIVSECTSRYSDRQASYILSFSARCKIDLQTWATQQTLGIDACKRKINHAFVLLNAQARPGQRSCWEWEKPPTEKHLSLRVS